MVSLSYKYLFYFSYKKYLQKKKTAKVLTEYNLNECISSLDFSKTGDYVSAGLIDERVLVYKIEENN